MTPDFRSAPDSSERRKLQRLPARESVVTSTAGELELINLCPTGMAVRSPSRRRLSIGEQHFFVVKDRGQTFEVAGEVRWLTPEEAAGAETRAGIAFVEVMHTERGLWAGVSPDRRVAGRGTAH